MGFCKTFQKYSGTKSQIIADMISNIKRKEREKKLPELSKDEQLLKLLNSWKVKNDIAKKAKAKLDEECKKKGVEWSSYNKENNGFRAAYSCDCTSIEESMLQKAQDFYALGQRAKAKEIWDKLIKKYNLDE